MAGTMAGQEHPLVTLDVRLATGQFTGIGRYTLNLLQPMLGLPGPHYMLLTTAAGAGLFRPWLPESVEVHETRWTVPDHPRSDLWLHLYLPQLLRSRRVAVHFSAANYLPAFSGGARRVVTIHDMVPFRHPGADPLKFTLFLKGMLRLAGRVADRIVTVSHFTGREVIELLGVLPERVRVVQNGPSPGFRVLSEEEDARQLAGHPEIQRIPRPYLLSVGVHIGRKNLPFLVDVLAAVRGSGWPHHLVLAGPPGPDTGVIEARIARHGLEDRVHLLSYPDDQALNLLYNRAEALVYPTLYEGFGLPVLEAFACGTPVVASNTSSLPEVAGDAALLVEPSSISQVTAALERIRSSDDLRRDLVAKGRERLGHFSWERAARETSGVLAELL